MKILFYIIALMAPAMTYSTNHCCPVPSTSLKDACNTFTSNMFTEIVTDNSGKSCVQSAFSLMFPLGQLALASVGPAHDDLLRTIAMPNDATIKEEFEAYTHQLGSFKEVEIHMANRVYVRSGYVLTREFKEEIRNEFLGTVKTLDFTRKSATAETINKYVEDQTSRRVRNIMRAIDIKSETVAIIVNAAAYKGYWEHEFNEDNTRMRPFYVNAHSNTTVKMMRQTNTFKYAESCSLAAKLLELPYKDSGVRFVAVLPNQYDGIDALINKVKNPARFSRGLKLMKDTVVSVALPRFKIETKTNLKLILSRMGVERLFTRGEAHLDKMVVEENDLFVSSGIQKTFIEVNEEGSVADAGSRFGVDEPSIDESDPKLFLADHPFLFYLLDQNDMILFNGVFKH